MTVAFSCSVIMLPFFFLSLLRTGSKGKSLKAQLVTICVASFNILKLCRANLYVYCDLRNYVLACGCETWSFTLGERHTLRSFWNGGERGVLRETCTLDEGSNDGLDEEVNYCTLHQILLR